jgi:hypothetical protein
LTNIAPARATDDGEHPVRHGRDVTKGAGMVMGAVDEIESAQSNPAPSSGDVDKDAAPSNPHHLLGPEMKAD